MVVGHGSPMDSRYYCNYLYNYNKDTIGSMRDPNRIDKFLKQLSRYWKQVPDWRFGQLLCNIQRYDGSDLFFKEDEDLLKLFREYFSE